MNIQGYSRQGEDDYWQNKLLAHTDPTCETCYSDDCFMCEDCEKNNCKCRCEEEDVEMD